MACATCVQLSPTPCNVVQPCTTDVKPTRNICKTLCNHVQPLYTRLQPLSTTLDILRVTVAQHFLQYMLPCATLGICSTRCNVCTTLCNHVQPFTTLCNLYAALCNFQPVVQICTIYKSPRARLTR